MKKELLFLLSVLMFSFAIAAPQLVMDSSFAFGESVLGAVEFQGEGYVLDETLSMTFKEGRRTVSMTYDVIRHEENFYFYLYPTTAGDYSLTIEGILYNDGGITRAIDLQKNFSVVSGAENILSVKPGFIFTSDEENLTITNKGNSSLDISTPSGSFTLSPLSSRKVLVDPSYDFSIFEIISYKTFKIPVIYYGGSTNPAGNQTIGNGSSVPGNGGVSLQGELIISPSYISLSLSGDETEDVVITIENTGSVGVDGIYVRSDYGFSIDNLSIDAEGQESIGFGFNSSDVDGKITIGFEGREVKIPVTFISETPSVDNRTCSSLRGVFCESSLNLTCGGEITQATDGLCCLTECVVIGGGRSPKTNWGIIVGVLIFFGLVGGGYYFFRKYKNVKSSSLSEDAQKERPKSSLKVVQPRELNYKAEIPQSPTQSKIPPLSDRDKKRVNLK